MTTSDSRRARFRERLEKRLAEKRARDVGAMYAPPARYDDAFTGVKELFLEPPRLFPELELPPLALPHDSDDVAIVTAALLRSCGSDVILIGERAADGSVTVVGAVPKESLSLREAMKASLARCEAEAQAIASCFGFDYEREDGPTGAEIRQLLHDGVT